MFPKTIKKASLFLLLASFVAAPGSCTLTYAGNIKCADKITSLESTDDTLVTAPSAILMEEKTWNQFLLIEDIVDLYNSGVAPGFCYLANTTREELGLNG